MAQNVPVFDLVNFPGTQKTVSIDLTEVVPLGNSGEDVWVFTSTTTATASGGASIAKLYINDLKLGWAKSSGLRAGPYDVTNTQRHLRVAIDEDIASAVQIALTVSALPLSGEDISRDIQTQLNAAGRTGGGKAGNLAYLKAICTYTNNTFKIVSGTSSTSYTGADRSSVAVADGTTTTGLAAALGFDIPTTSEVLASSPVKQTTLASNYSSGTGLTVSTSGIIVTGDAIAITNGTTTEYRGVQTAAGVSVVLASGLANSYTSGSKIQVLRMQDASSEPPPAYNKIDDYIKYGIAYIANQINFG
jgi:hypothetical protein